MQFAVFGILFLFVLGCINSEEPAAETAPQTNITVSLPENISETAVENETITEQNETIGSTANVTANGSAEVVEEALPEEDRILFGGGKYALVIEDVVWQAGTSCAAISIEYADGGVLKKDVVCPRADYYWTSPAGHRYRILVSQVAAGYTGETWAEVYVYG